MKKISLVLFLNTLFVCSCGVFDDVSFSDIDDHEYATKEAPEADTTKPNNPYSDDNDYKYDNDEYDNDYEYNNDYEYDDYGYSKDADEKNRDYEFTQNTLPTCNKMNEGVQYISLDRDIAFICKSNSWIPQEGISPHNDLNYNTYSSSSSKTNASSDISNPKLYSGFIWVGEEGSPFIDTNHDNGTKTSGYWYSFDDYLDGGESQILWPIELGNAYDETSLEPVIYECKGVCGSFVLNKGDLIYDPFIEIAFNVAGTYPSALEKDPFAKTPAEPTDVSSWNGICLTYIIESDNAVLELSMGDTLDFESKNFLPKVSLPEAREAKEFCAKWSEFKQIEVNGIKHVTGEEAAKNLATIRIRIRGKTGDFGYFNITKIGGYKIELK